VDVAVDTPLRDDLESSCHSRSRPVVNLVISQFVEERTCSDRSVLSSRASVCVVLPGYPSCACIVINDILFQLYH